MEPVSGFRAAADGTARGATSSIRLPKMVPRPELKKDCTGYLGNNIYTEMGA